MFMFGCSALMTPEGHPGQHAYTVVIRILSTSLTSVFSVDMASIQFHFCQFTPHLSFHTKLNIYLKLIQLYICTVHILQSYISDISFSCVTNMTCMIGPLRVQLALLPRGVLQISLSPSCELSLLMYGVERRRKTRDLTRTRFLKTCVEAVA
jgi:hypothetical protein